MDAAKQKSRIFVCLLFSFFSARAYCQSDAANIRRIMQSSEDAWNHGDINAFMQGYWKSDSVMFIGNAGIVYGWQQTLERYKKAYPTGEAMGMLKFTLLEVKPLSGSYYFVVGKWHLTRKSGDIGGIFDLLFEKIKGEWLIIADHSS